MAKPESGLGGRILSVRFLRRRSDDRSGGHFINSDHGNEGVGEFGLELFDRAEDAKRFPFPDSLLFQW